MEDLNSRWGWASFFDEMESFLNDLCRQDETQRVSESYCEYAVDRLKICIQSIASLVNLLRSSSRVEDSVVAEQHSLQLVELLRCLRKLHSKWQGRMEGDDAAISSAYSASVLRTGSLGRPRLLISEEQLQYLRSMSFSWRQISKLLGVSIMTVFRRRREYGMSSQNDGARISHDELRTVLHRLRQELPTLGQTMMWGRLRSMGFKVTREKVRKIMRQDDPINTALRWRGVIAPRQPYTVAGPNSLWHQGEFKFYLLSGVQ